MSRETLEKMHYDIEQTLRHFNSPAPGGMRSFSMLSEKGNCIVEEAREEEEETKQIFEIAKASPPSGSADKIQPTHRSIEEESRTVAPDNLGLLDKPRLQRLLLAFIMHRPDIGYLPVSFSTS